ncbi:hypothetical protein ACFLVS_00520 [Chloroflexota bacterium]
MTMKLFLPRLMITAVILSLLFLILMASPVMAQQLRVPVGGEVYPVNRVAILAPWITLAAGIVVGASVVLTRRKTHS